MFCNVGEIFALRSRNKEQCIWMVYLFMLTQQFRNKQIKYQRWRIIFRMRELVSVSFAKAIPLMEFAS